MNGARPPRYSSPLRHSQREATREAILQSVRRRLEAGTLEDANFGEIAADAGVAERTVYRYFPTREALLGAFWTWLQIQAVVEPPRAPITPQVPVLENADRPMRIMLATDAWEPQVNGVVRTLTRVVAELKAMGHAVEVISPDQFKTFPLPTYPEIKLAVGAYEPVQERFKAL